jgi:cytochrome P450
MTCPIAHGGDFNPFGTPHFAGLHEMMATARDATPVLYSESLHMWVVLRHDDASAILRDSKTFSSSTRPVILSQFVDEAREILQQTKTFSAPNLGFDGRPEHDRLRRPVSGFFSAKGIARREPRIRELARRQLDRMPSDGSVELSRSFAGPLASAVILDLAGLPPEDHDRIMRYHDAVAGFFFGVPAPEVQVQAAKDVQEWEQYLAEFVALRRRRPADDLTTHLLRRIANGKAQYSEDEVISFLSFDVVTAGIRPTSFAINNVCRELLRDRRYWCLPAGQAAVFDDVFSESMRRRGLSLGVFRQATRDVEIRGAVIPQGSLVWVLVASTSHDENQFPEPDIFDPYRQNLSSSLHFSHGLHYCLGSYLAKAVTRIGVELLQQRYPEMALVPDQTIEYEPSMNLMIPTKLLVALRGAVDLPTAA